MKPSARRLVLPALLASVLVLAAAGAGLAAPPPNDDFAAAQVLDPARSGATPIATTNVDATKEPGEPSTAATPAARRSGSR